LTSGRAAGYTRMQWFAQRCGQPPVSPARHPSCSALYRPDRP